ncbi:hypothetical protein [Marichromatium sp. PS1]|uniref:hypothetical protein n=1 Tax=Marichromatium sp. PS1 TaxID=3138932 RepID=UPI0034E8A9C5
MNREGKEPPAISLQPPASSRQWLDIHKHWRQERASQMRASRAVVEVEGTPLGAGRLQPGLNREGKKSRRRSASSRQWLDIHKHWRQERASRMRASRAVVEGALPLVAGGWWLVLQLEPLCALCGFAVQSWRLAAGGWRLAAGGWRLAAGGWRLAAGGSPFTARLC